MDVGLTSEQLSLRDAVRDVLRTECPPDAARQAMTDPERWRTLWKTVVDLGWTELAAPDASDYGPVEMAVVLEECGAAIAPIPLLSSVGLAAGALRAGGPAFDSVLADIAGGVVATLAVHSRGSRLPGAPMTLRQGTPARTGGRGPQPVPRRADRHAGARRRAVSWRRSRAAASGVTVLAGESTDPAQPVADVEIDAEPWPPRPCRLESALTAPLVAAAADLVGVASAALHRSVEHAKARRQFGTPIGAFQGIKHALADNHVSVERARSLTYAAAARSPIRTPGTPGPPRRWPRRRPATRRPIARAPRCRCTARSGRPGSTTSTSTSGTPGRAPRCWATVARSTTRWAAGSQEARDDVQWSRNSAPG